MIVQVEQLKETISKEKGWEVDKQKLIYSGKILDNAKTVGSYNIEEKGFIVCMVTKVRAIESLHKIKEADEVSGKNTTTSKFFISKTSTDTSCIHKNTRRTRCSLASCPKLKQRSKYADASTSRRI